MTDNPEKLSDLIPEPVKQAAATPDLAAGTPHPTEPPCAVCGAVWTTNTAGRWVINHDPSKHSRGTPVTPSRADVPLAPEPRDPLVD